jgi:UDP-N-acetylglucosamine transferase subunit ALG13
VILFTVGTHEQPMSRFVPVLAEIARLLPELGPFVAQHGATALPAGWTGTQEVDRGEMARLLATADIVIAHGGPATIAEARAAGRLPIVVPRRAGFGEHVDDHQVAYARRLAAAGEVLIVEDAADLLATIRDYDRAAAALRPPEAHDPGPAVAAFAEIVGRLIRR